MVNFSSMLVIILLILKITGYVEITWLWVFAPIWMICSFAIIVFIAILALAPKEEIKNFMSTLLSKRNKLPSKHFFLKKSLYKRP